MLEESPQPRPTQLDMHVEPYKLVYGFFLPFGVACVRLDAHAPYRMRKSLDHILLCRCQAAGKSADRPGTSELQN